MRWSALIEREQARKWRRLVTDEEAPPADGVAQSCEETLDPGSLAASRDHDRCLGERGEDAVEFLFASGEGALGDNHAATIEDAEVAAAFVDFDANAEVRHGSARFIEKTRRRVSRPFPGFLLPSWACQH